MFVGHYGVTFAIKAARRTIPLWVLFIAVQLLDVGWSILVLFGIEKVRIVPGITASNPLDLYYMPYTHSLIAAILWSVAAGGLAKLVRLLRDWSAMALLAVGVFSHWVLDWLVHQPDLPLYDNAMKVGLGLWNYPAAALTLEAVLLFVGIIMYLRSGKPANTVGRFGPLVFGFVMLAIQGYIFFGPPPVSPSAAAITALASYIVFAALAQWLDGQRIYVSAADSLDRTARVSSVP
jgi:hypothetical protein